MKHTTYLGGTEFRSKPENLIKTDVKLFQHEFQKEISKSYVLNCSKVYLSEKNVINLKNMKMYFKYTYMSNPPLKNIIKVILNFLKLRKKTINTMDNGVWVINNKSENYFHWMTETLTRVISFKTLNIKSKILIPEKFLDYEFVPKTLDLLKVDYQTYSKNNLIKVNNLHLTSNTAPAGNYNSKAIYDLHSWLSNGSKSSPGKKLWVSRKYSGRRVLSNEEEVIPILEKYGIELIYPEKLTYAQQIKLFREAEFLAGVAGAALVNMLYMEMNQTVLELRSERDELNNCHYSLAVTLKHKYYYEKCKSDIQENMTVNINDLESTFKKIFPASP